MIAMGNKRMALNRIEDGSINRMGNDCWERMALIRIENGYK